MTQPGDSIVTFPIPFSSDIHKNFVCKVHQKNGAMHARLISGRAIAIERQFECFDKAADRLVLFPVLLLAAFRTVADTEAT